VTNQDLICKSERMDKYTFVDDSWYEIRFGLHNYLNVHGATPAEMLHWLQLGKYKYPREMFLHKQEKKQSFPKESMHLPKPWEYFTRDRAIETYQELTFPKEFKEVNLWRIR